jgi:nitrous oxidase accessory protein NosD
VDNEGDGEYITIQAALDAAHPGDTIEVYSGTYNEHIIVMKEVSLNGIDHELGNGSDTGKPVIDAQGTESVVTITADNVNITGFIIQNGVYGIFFTTTNCSRIIGNTITGNSKEGIHVGVPSHSNLFVYNLFIENTLHAFDNSTNAWNATVGNYWDDYFIQNPGGVDANHDGLWDTPYNISGGENQDLHPLAIPPPAKINVEIRSPQENILYFRDHPIMPFFVTFIIGKITLMVNATGTHGIGVERVEFSIDGKLEETDYEKPYTWTWNIQTLLPRKHTINVTAYNEHGDHKNDEIIVWKIL